LKRIIGGFSFSFWGEAAMTFVRSTWLYRASVLLLLTALGPSVVAQTSAPFDLQNVAEKPLAVVWSRPQEHLKNPVLAELFKFFSEAPPNPRDKEMISNIAQVDAVRMSFGAARSAWSPKPIPQAVTLIHTTNPAAATSLLKSMTAGQEEKTTPEWKSPIYTGKPFGPPGEVPDPNAWKLQRGVTQLDPQTIVQTDNIELMLKTLTTKPEAPVWAADLAAIANPQSLYLVDLAQFRELIKDEKGPPGAGMEAMIFNSVKPLWEQADYAFMKIDTTQGLQIAAFAKSPNTESAQRFKGALEGLIAMGKGFLPMAKQGLAQLNQVMPGQGDQLYSDLEALVASIKIIQSDTKTVMTLSIPQDTLVRLMKAMMPAMQAARAQAMAVQSQNNLRQIALALHSYHDTHRGFPPAVKLGPDGKTPHSWRVAILPFIEEQALYNQYKFDEPWDSENNKKVAAAMPRIYRSINATNGANCTSYVVLTHADGVFNATPAAKGTELVSITDGTSNTVAVVEANAEIPWTKPEDLAIVDGQPLPTLGLPGAATFNVAFCDGSVQRLTTKLTDEFRKLITKSDGNVVDLNALRPQDGAMPGRPPVGPPVGPPGGAPFNTPVPPGANALPPGQVPQSPPTIPAPQ
jgi:prepilin-type processing-associated H-X9-DG protein